MKTLSQILSEGVLDIDLDTTIDDKVALDNLKHILRDYTGWEIKFEDDTLTLSDSSNYARIFIPEHIQIKLVEQGVQRIIVQPDRFGCELRIAEGPIHDWECPKGTIYIADFYELTGYSLKAHIINFDEPNKSVPYKFKNCKLTCSQDGGALSLQGAKSMMFDEKCKISVPVLRIFGPLGPSLAARINKLGLAVFKGSSVELRTSYTDDEMIAADNLDIYKTLGLRERQWKDLVKICVGHTFGFYVDGIILAKRSAGQLINHIHRQAKGTLEYRGTWYGVIGRRVEGETN